MTSDRVIEPVDISGHGVFGLLAELPCNCPDQLCLDGLEVRLHHRVVVAVAAPTHRDRDAPSAEQRLIVYRAVLRPTVGMMDQSRRGVAGHQSTAQGFDREISLQAVTRRPANDAPREEVENDGEVEPALCRPDVGDVRPPFPVWAVRREVLRHQIGGDRPGMFAVRRALEALLLPRGQLVLSHQARRAMTPDLVPIIDEVAVHAGTAVGAVRKCEGRSDMRQIDHVLLLLTTTGGALLPGEEPALADSQNTAHPDDWKAGLLRCDEAEGHRLPSFAKKAAAS